MLQLSSWQFVAIGAQTHENATTFCLFLQSQKRQRPICWPIFIFVIFKQFDCTMITSEFPVVAADLALTEELLQFDFELLPYEWSRENKTTFPLHHLRRSGWAWSSCFCLLLHSLAQIFLCRISSCFSLTIWSAAVKLAVQVARFLRMFSKKRMLQCWPRSRRTLTFSLFFFKSAGLISAWKMPWMHFALVCGVFKASDLFLSAILLQMVDLNLPWWNASSEMKEWTVVRCQLMFFAWNLFKGTSSCPMITAFSFAATMRPFSVEGKWWLRLHHLEKVEAWWQYWHSVWSTAF